MTDSGVTPPFTPGLVLSRRFFDDIVRPILTERFPRLEYAAALIGPGSEVLGFDTSVSTDHHWGPRVLLFVSDKDLGALQSDIHETLSRQLPHTFLGYATNFGPPDEIGVRLLQPIEDGPIEHRVELATVADWFSQYLGWNTEAAPSLDQWLTFPQHRLRATTTGAVFRDDLGCLSAARAALEWYPDDLWRYLLAAQWKRIAEEEAFMARCGDVGDELGSTVIAARLVRDIMQLCFLMERQYAPHAKWFGTAFLQLDGSNALEPLLLDAMRLESWHERQGALAATLELIATLHNSLGITEPLDPSVRNFYGRPYLVIGAERFASAIESRISDEAVLRLPPRLGSLNQLINGTDTLESTQIRKRLENLYA
jgi:hypothetical protein